MPQPDTQPEEEARDPETHDDTGPQACDYDMADPEHLQAVWLEFQRERGASCPVTENAFDLALSHDPAEDGGGVAEVSVACDLCGRTVSFSPPDASEVFGWAE